MVSLQLLSNLYHFDLIHFFIQYEVGYPEVQQTNGECNKGWFCLLSACGFPSPFYRCMHFVFVAVAWIFFEVFDVFNFFRLPWGKNKPFLWWDIPVKLHPFKYFFFSCFLAWFVLIGEKQIIKWIYCYRAGADRKLLVSVSPPGYAAFWWQPGWHFVPVFVFCSWPNTNSRWMRYIIFRSKPRPSWELW